MREISCLIVDDEELARTLLENYVGRLSYLTLMGKCNSPISALEILQANSIDLLFLDIQMPDMLGTEFLKTLSKKPKVILTTAYSEYAVEGFELNVVDYLLKPFSFERFLLAVNKACDLIELNRKVQAPLNTQSSNSIDYILVKADHKTHRIFYSDILYIQSMREYVAFYTPTARILSLGSLKGLEETLPTSSFIRVHKSYIIAKNKATTLEGNMIQIAKEKIPIGASYREKVLKDLF